MKMSYELWRMMEMECLFEKAMKWNQFFDWISVGKWWEVWGYRQMLGCQALEMVEAIEREAD